MKQLAIVILFSFNISCSKSKYYENIWKSHQSEFEAIVDLVKNEKLPVIYGRAGYSIPDSFTLRSIVGPVVFQDTDFTYDNTNSILLRIGFDTSKSLRSYPTIVYTNNQKRINEYNKGSNPPEKFNENWYFLPAY